MKKVYILIISILMVVSVCGCTSSNNSNNEDTIAVDNREKNYLGGYGKFHQPTIASLGNNYFYDDEYIYLYIAQSTLVSFSRKNGSYRPICVDASCDHGSTSCVANKTYFVYKDKLYYIRGGSQIIDTDTGKLVHTVTVPKEYKEAADKDRYKPISWDIGRINDDYLIINANRYAYIVDENFNTIYYHKRSENCKFAYIDGDNYYYGSDFLFYKANIKTGEVTTLDCESFVFNIDINNKGMFYSNTFSELYRYDIDTGESTFLADGADHFLAMDDYIFYVDNHLNDEVSLEEYDRNIIVLDENGDKCGEIVNTTNGYVSGVNVAVIDDKVYFYDDINHVFTMANVDGSNLVTVDCSTYYN